MKKTLYFEAPNYHQPGNLDKNKNVFLGGSISGAADWQKEVAKALLPYFNVFNPRRKDYKMFDVKVEREQIQWEFLYLSQCDIILFYFDCATLAPITLLELGKFLGRKKYNHWQKAYVAIHPEYKRKNDVIIQTELEYPEMVKNITFSLSDTVEMIIKENP